MTLDSAGDLGLGVTPSAWGSGETAIQLAGTTFGNGVFSSSNNTAVIVGANAYYSSTGYKRIVAAASSIIQFAVGETRFLTANSSTADSAISFTQAMTLDASGNLVVGDTSVTATSERVSIRSNSSPNLILRSTGNPSMRFYNSADNSGNSCQINYYSGTSFSLEAIPAIPMVFLTTNLERARITSDGHFLVKTTTATGFQDGLSLYQDTGNSQLIIGHGNGATSGNAYAGFLYNGSVIGNITQNGTTAVAYNTTSDYRLKNTIAPMTGALAKVALLKPVTYKWNADGSDGEGFIAHELAEVCPSAVTGAKDAVDADGKPQYQGIDVSFLVATLTAAIQEQQAIIESLKARLDAANL
jgi:hypothetical protein